MTRTAAPIRQEFRVVLCTEHAEPSALPASLVRAFGSFEPGWEVAPTKAEARSRTCEACGSADGARVVRLVWREGSNRAAEILRGIYGGSK